MQSVRLCIILCGKHLKRHIRDKSIKCNQCDFASAREDNMKKHLKTHISVDKLNKCNQCDYASYNAGYLRKHFEIHSEEKTYNCNQCD